MRLGDGLPISAAVVLGELDGAEWGRGIGPQRLGVRLAKRSDDVGGGWGGLATSYAATSPTTVPRTASLVSLRSGAKFTQPKTDPSR